LSACRRVDENRRREAAGLPRIEYGLALHLGSLGVFPLKGVGLDQEIFAPARTG
jgi:hypothetical protein